MSDHNIPDSGITINVIKNILQSRTKRFVESETSNHSTKNGVQESPIVMEEVGVVCWNEGNLTRLTGPG